MFKKWSQKGQANRLSAPGGGSLTSTPSLFSSQNVADAAEELLNTTKEQVERTRDAADEDKTTTRDDEPQSLFDKEFSGYVNVADIMDEVCDANFEYEETNKFDVASNAVKYKFERRARRSILVTLGLSHETVLNSSIDIYQKSSNKDASRIIMGVIIGVGSVDMPAAMARCGLVPGMIVLLIFSVLNHFLCNRILEAPFWLERNFENLNQTVGVLLSSAAVRALTFISVVAWLSPIVFYLASFSDQVEELFLIAEIAKEGDYFIGPDWIFDYLSENQSLIQNIATFIVVLVFFFFTAKAKSIKVVKRGARLCVSSMVLVGIGIITGAAWYHFVHQRSAFIDDTNDGDTSVFASDNDTSFREMKCSFEQNRSLLLSGNHSMVRLTPRSAEDFSEGVQDLILAFGGIMVIPYIVAEMASPAESRKVISRTIWMISAFYFVVGVGGYIGFGDIVLCWPNPARLMVRIPFDNGLEKILFITLGTLITIFLLVKSVATIPLFLWPLIREFKVIVSYFEDPASELQLPWARVRDHRQRMWWRGLIMFLVVLFFVLFQYDSVNGKIFGVQTLIVIVKFLPGFFMSLLLPSLIAVFSIQRHKQLMKERALRKVQLQLHILESRALSCPSMSTPLNAPVEAVKKYYLGKYSTHLFASWVSVALVLQLLFLSILVFLPPDTRQALVGWIDGLVRFIGDMR